MMLPKIYPTVIRSKFVSDAGEIRTVVKPLKLKIPYSRCTSYAPRISALLRNLVCYGLYHKLMPNFTIYIIQA